MKNASLLIALCVLFSLSAVAQSTTTVEKNTNRITITTKKVDDNGKTITETWIAEGDEPAKILEDMAINPEIIQKVEIEKDAKADEERLFLFRSAGDNVVIEGSLNENASSDQIREVIIINQNGDHPEQSQCTKISRWHDGGDHPRAHAYVYVGGDRKSNCAALGVWANATEETNGARINGLIENGGAQEAGLLEGDVITRIDGYDISDFPTLHEALSHFKPGDRVTVRYDREGKSLKSKVTLKDWAELPGHEWRSRDDCGKPETPTEDQGMLDDPSSTPNLQTLVLEDARVYPNPSDGDFVFSFKSEPGPVTVTITDVNGKVVFQENNENGSGSYSREIDLKEMPQGNYIIAVKQNDKLFSQQISKQ